MVVMRLVGLALVAALAGCGGDSDDGSGGASGAAGASGMGGNSNDVGPSGICERLAQIQCAAEAECCDNPGRTVAACETAVQRLCTQWAFEQIAADPLVGFDRAALTTAFTELERRSQECDPAVAAWVLSTDGFGSSFTGTRNSGDDCTPEGGADSADVPAFGAAVASCRNVATTACLPSGEEWTCAARSAANGPCFTDLNCQDGLYCDFTGASDLFDGACTTRKAAGAECAQANECASFVCVDDACASRNDVQAAYCLAG